MINIQKYSKLFWISGLSVADQLVFSSGNFILNIFLVRFMAPTEYGAFAIAFAFFLLISGFYNVFFYEPLSVIGHTRYGNNVEAYLGAVIHMQIIFSVLSTVLFTVILSVLCALKAVDNIILFSLIGASLAAPAILFLWLLRRICYLDGDAHTALLGSSIYTVFLLMTLVVANHFNLVSPFVAFIIMLSASAMSSIFLWHVLSERIVVKNFLRQITIMQSIFNDHWHYSRWLAGATITYWLGGDFYLVLIGVFMGVAQVGAYGAIGNLMTPFLQMMTGISLFLIPWLARKKVNQGVLYVRRNVPKLILVSVLLAVSYSCFILMNGKSLVHVLYRNSYFDNYIWLLPFLAIIATLTAVKQSLGMVVRVTEQPEALFWATLLSSLFALSAGILLICKWKFYGVVTGISMGILLECAVMFYYIKRSAPSVGRLNV